MYKEHLIENRFSEDIFKTIEISSLDSTSSVLEEENVLHDSCSVYGRIIGVSSDSTYKRLLLRKVYDKCVFGQKMSDMCNTIILRTKNGEITKDIHVYLYGHLSGGISELKVGSKVEVIGRYDSRNRFMARRILVDSVQIRTQIEMVDIMLWIIPIMSIFFMFGFGCFLENIPTNINKEFWFIEMIAFAGGYSISWKLLKKLFRYYIPFRKKIKCSFIGALIIAVVIAFII